MKSRTSFCNGPAFWKNLTRFAPLWGGYILCLLLGAVLLVADDMNYWFAANLASMCSGMAVINLGYALLTAQILFGDLYNTRMCYALHAMPLRRECWFTTHVFSGLFFSLLPTAVMSAVCMVLLSMFSNMVNGWQIPLYFLLAANLQYLFFFGLAVLCAVCAGNRVGMALLYAIVNFFSYLVYFLVDTLVRPMHYGAITPEEPYKLLCPVAKLTETRLVECWRHTIAGMAEAGTENMYGTFTLTQGWCYLALVAAVGILLLLVARGVYRRRQLESAGDLLAAKKLAPVFMVVFSVTMGTVFHFVRYLFLSTYNGFSVLLPAGVAVGWFVGRMLLERQSRVFRSLKNWLGLIVLMVFLTGLLFGLSLDPFGVEDWVPQASDVREVTIANGYRGVVKTDDPDEIADIIAIHEFILEEKLTGAEAEAVYTQARALALETPEVQSKKVSAYDMTEKMGYPRYASIDLHYTLRSGRKVDRSYVMWLENDRGELANRYFSRVDAVFYHNDKISTAEDLLKLAGTPDFFFIDNVRLPEKFMTEDVVEGLFRAVIADCEAGTMTQDKAYHRGVVIDKEDHLVQYFRVDIDLAHQGVYFNIYADSEHCMEYLRESGILDCYLAAVKAGQYG